MQCNVSRQATAPATPPAEQGRPKRCPSQKKTSLRPWMRWKNHKKSIMLPRKSAWKLFSSGSAAHADLRSPLGETRHPSQKSNFHLCQVKITTSEKDFVPGKNHNYGAILMVVTESWSKECSKCTLWAPPRHSFLNSLVLVVLYLI